MFEVDEAGKSLQIMREESEGGEEAEVDKCIGWKLEMCIGE